MVKEEIDLLCQFLFLGGRGHYEEIWPQKSYSVDEIRKTYTKNTPIESISRIRYDTQEILSYSRHQKRYSAIAGAVKGFLRPPYSGWFNLLIKGDDQSEFLLSSGMHNRSKSTLVSKENNLLYFFVQGQKTTSVFMYTVFNQLFPLQD